MRELIIKFFAGEISDAEINLIKLWLNRGIENKHIFDWENDLWQLAGMITIPERSTIELAWRNISSELGIGDKVE